MYNDRLLIKDIRQIIFYCSFLIQKNHFYLIEFDNLFLQLNESYLTILIFFIIIAFTDEYRSGAISERKLRDSGNNYDAVSDDAQHSNDLEDWNQWKGIGESGYTKKWDFNRKHKWEWGDGGARARGSWGSDNGIGNEGLWNNWLSRNDNDECCKFGESFESPRGWNDLGREYDWGGTFPKSRKSGSRSWGNINSEYWKSSGGGEGWTRWEGKYHNL